MLHAEIIAAAEKDMVPALTGLITEQERCSPQPPSPTPKTLFTGE